VRGADNQQLTREYIIGQGGITVIEENEEEADGNAVPQLPFSSYYGLLARSPSRRSPVIEEALSKGKGLPESSAPAVRDMDKGQ
jgi:circadian clock protein KaiC